MARYQHIDQNPRSLPVDLAAQLLPGTFEHAAHHRLAHAVDLSPHGGRLRHDDAGASGDSRAMRRANDRSSGERRAAGVAAGSRTRRRSLLLLHRAGLVGSAGILGVQPAGDAPPDARGTVARLYHDFADEAQLAPPQDRLAFVGQPRDILTRYFDQPLTALLVAEHTCGTQTSAGCRLAFAPLWGTQAADARDATIRRTRNPAIVTVRLTGSEGSHYVQLTYRLVQTREGWRVHDIAYPSAVSLRHLLARGGRR